MIEGVEQVTWSASATRTIITIKRVLEIAGAAIVAILAVISGSEGISYMISSITRSMMLRRPRAPRSISRAWSATASKASWVKVSSTLSYRISA